MNKILSEVGLDKESFNQIAQLAYAESGLQLSVEKSSMIQSRLRHRLRALDLPDFESYTLFVCSDAGRDERRHMISALTTNVSHFFREQHHFDTLRQEFISGKIDSLKQGNRLRIWSAGCSNGQEACSIAITLLEAFPEVSKLDVKILATDIDPNVVAFAKSAVYPSRMVNGITPDLLTKYFDREQEKGEDLFRPKRDIQNMISFKELNLLAAWPMKQKFDFIFCRNVVIYFDLPTQEKLWPRFRSTLTNDGLLFLGHSERIADSTVFDFASWGPTTYRPLHSPTSPTYLT